MRKSRIDVIVNAALRRTEAIGPDKADRGSPLILKKRKKTSEVAGSRKRPNCQDFGELPRQDGVLHLEKPLPGPDGLLQLNQQFTGQDDEVRLGQTLPGEDGGVQLNQALPGEDGGIQLDQDFSGQDHWVQPNQSLPGQDPNVQRDQQFPGQNGGLHQENSMVPPDQSLTGQDGAVLDQEFHGSDGGMQQEKDFSGQARGVQPNQSLPGEDPNVQRDQQFPGQNGGMQQENCMLQQDQSLTGQDGAVLDQQQFPGQDGGMQQEKDFSGQARGMQPNLSLLGQYPNVQRDQQFPGQDGGMQQEHSMVQPDQSLTVQDGAVLDQQFHGSDGEMQQEKIFSSQARGVQPNLSLLGQYPNVQRDQQFPGQDCGMQQENSMVQPDQSLTGQDGAVLDQQFPGQDGRMQHQDSGVQPDRSLYGLDPPLSPFDQNEYPTEFLNLSLFSDDSLADPDFDLNQENIPTPSLNSSVTSRGSSPVNYQIRPSTSTPNPVLNNDEPPPPSPVRQCTDRPRRVKKAQEKSERDANKHPVRLLKCNDKCKRKCTTFSDDDRRAVWKQYWKLDYTSRRKWLASCMKISKVKRRTVAADVPSSYRKTESRYYFLKKDNVEISVCRSFLLNTLGYTNDSVLTELSKVIKSESLFGAVKENRGGKNQKECNSQIIKDHVESYNPTVSHYRRKNAPRARYLPIGLTIAAMYADFEVKHPGECKIDTYRKTLKKMHVSLRTPKGDRCYDCMMHDLQENTDQASLDAYGDHKRKADVATMHYGIDRWTPESNNTKTFSMDLQKVLLIPQMPSCKESFFISRLAVFNLTFSPLKRSSSLYNSYCCLWNEAYAGRDAKNIIDSLKRLIQEERDTESFIFWTDNCGAQNKNWFLYTALVSIVNTENLKSVCIKYLTKGHTHMTADAVHGNIEKRLTKVREIYDYSDLKREIQGSRKHLKVLDVTEFHDWPKKKRFTTKVEDPLKTFLLGPLVEVKFEKGSRKMLFKTSFEDDYEEIDFMQKRCKIPLEPNRINARGVHGSKKKEILEKLVPLMKVNRRQFWFELPESDTNIDLGTDGDVEINEEA